MIKTIRNYTIPKIDLSLPLSSYKKVEDLFPANYSVKDILWELVSDTDWLVLANDGIGYVSDMQFDFKTGELYIPIYICNEYDIEDITNQQADIIQTVFGHTKLHAQYGIEKLVLIKYMNTGYQVINSDFLLLHKTNHLISKVDLCKYPIINQNDYESSRPVEELFMKYILSAYSFKEPQDINRYVHITSAYSKLLKRYDLSLWQGYYELAKYPCMQYKKEEINQLGLLNKEEMNLPYYIRRLPYLFDLYFSIIERTKWTGFTRGNIDKVINQEHLFCRYTVGSVSLIFKSEWYLQTSKNSTIESFS